MSAAQTTTSMRAEWAAARRRRQRRLAAGLPPTDLVDAQPVRDHVRKLQAQGMGWKRIAAHARVANGTLSNILHGGNGYPPSPRTRRETADRLLAVQLDVADFGDTDGTGTRRRLQALVAVGWTARALADRLGWDYRNFHDLLNGRGRVRGITERRVAQLYDQLWDRQPPTETAAQRRAASRARNHASRRGWAVPMAWSDEDLDDPAAQPDFGYGRPGTAAANADLVALLLAQGLTPSEIVAKTGLSRSSVFRLRGKRAS